LREAGGMPANGLDNRRDRRIGTRPSSAAERLEESRLPKHAPVCAESFGDAVGIVYQCIFPLELIVSLPMSTASMMPDTTGQMGQDARIRRHCGEGDYTDHDPKRRTVIMDVPLSVPSA